MDDIQTTMPEDTNDCPNCNYRRGALWLQITISHEQPFYQIVCDNCGLRSPEERKIEDAVKLWNGITLDHENNNSNQEGE